MLLVVSLYFGVFKVVKTKCYKLSILAVSFFQVFVCVDSLLVVCLFVSVCFPLSLVDSECLRWFSVVLYLV